jgi:hypothetical protein
VERRWFYETLLTAKTNSKRGLKNFSMEMRAHEGRIQPYMIVPLSREIFRRTRTFALLALLLSLPCDKTRAGELFFDFSKDRQNETPAGFQSTVSGDGKPGIWKIIDDEVSSTIPSVTPNAAPQRRAVVAQLSRDLTDEHYPILVYTNEVFGDFKFTTRIKCVSGVAEQMAGVVFRYQDEKNYYYLRASSKGSTFRFLKVVAGQRSAPIGPELQIPAGVWHEIAVECKGNQINCFLDGKQEIPTLTDNSFSAGKIGFWTKSDSVSHFADARVTYTPRVPFIRTLLRQAKETYPRVEALKVFARTPENPELRIVASTEDTEIGTPAGETEPKVIENDSPYIGRIDANSIVVTLPLHDRNGEVIAALRVELKAFFGQTEKNAVARAAPIAKQMEKGIVEAKDLF